MIIIIFPFFFQECRSKTSCQSIIPIHPYHHTPCCRLLLPLLYPHYPRQLSPHPSPDEESCWYSPWQPLSPTLPFSRSYAEEVKSLRPPSPPNWISHASVCMRLESLQAYGTTWCALLANGCLCLYSPVNETGCPGESQQNHGAQFVPRSWPLSPAFSVAPTPPSSLPYCLSTAKPPSVAATMPNFGNFGPPRPVCGKRAFSPFWPVLSLVLKWPLDCPSLFVRRESDKKSWWVWLPFCRFCPLPSGYGCHALGGQIPLSLARRSAVSSIIPHVREGQLP